MKLSIKKPSEDSKAHPEHGHRIVIKHHEPMAGHASPPSQHAAPRSRVPWLWIHCSLMLLTIGVAFGIFRHTRVEAAQKERREALAVHAAITQMTGSMDRIQRTMKRIQDAAAAFPQWVAEGSNLVRSVIPNSTVLREEPSAEDILRVTTPQEPPPAQAQAPAAAAPAPAEGDDDPARPYGMPSRAKMEALHSAQAAPSATAGDTTAPRAAAGAPAAQKPQLAPIEDAMVALKKLDADMSALTSQSTERQIDAKTMIADAGQKTESATMADYVSKLAEMAAAAEAAQQEAARLCTGAETRIAEIRELKQKTEAAQKEAQRKAEQERKEQEQKALIAREVAAAAEAHQATTNLVAWHDYAQAVSNLTAALGSMTTDEGKRAMQRHVDRFQLMKELKDFLVARIRKEPYPWGWGSGPTARDVTGADETGIKLHGVRVEWKELDAPQMLKFLRFYLVQKKVDKDLYARMSLAAAVYFNEVGQAAQTSKYMRDAIGTDLLLRQEATRLIESE